MTNQTQQPASSPTDLGSTRGGNLSASRLERAPLSDDLGLTQILLALRLYTGPIVLAPLLAGGIAYIVSRSQPPVYAATSTLLSAGNQTGNSQVNNTLVSAPPLPQGALERALSSKNVRVRIVAKVDTALTAATPIERAQIKASLTQLEATRRVSYALTSRLDFAGNGIYDVRAEYGRPIVAAQLADLAAEELVRWDTLRGAEKVIKSREALEAQLEDNNARLRSLGGSQTNPTIEKSSLLDQRALLNNQFNSISALERAVSGTLSVLALADVPTAPVQPRPLRQAFLSGLLVLFVSVVLVLLRVTLDRTVSSDADLRALDLRPLGEVPRLKAGKGNMMLGALRRGQAAERISFLRANLNTLLFKSKPRVILVTSAAPGEGKSSLTAALASAFAVAGQRTLLIDADLRRPRQLSLWGPATQPSDWMSLPGSPAPSQNEGARDLQAALKQPEALQTRRLRENLNLLPAGPVSTQAAELFSGGTFGAALKLWSLDYDVVLIDSPPVLAVSDPMLIAPHTSGVLVVTEAGRTSQSALRQVVNSLALFEVNVLGAVLNKVDLRRREGYYGYGYGYGYGYANQTSKDG